MKIVRKMGVSEQDCDSRLIEQVTLTSIIVHDYHVLKKLIPTETKAVYAVREISNACWKSFSKKPAIKLTVKMLYSSDVSRARARETKVSLYVSRVGRQSS